MDMEGIKEFQRRLDHVKGVFPDCEWDTDHKGNVILVTHEAFSDIVGGGVDTNPTAQPRLTVAPDGSPVVTD